MKMMGVDLGIHKVAVFCTDEPYALAHQASKDDPRDAQLHQLAGVVHDTALFQSPDGVWIEDVLVGNNRKYSLQLAEVKGAVLSALAPLRARGMDIRVINVQGWKRGLLGSGHASKDEVRDYIDVTHGAYAPVCGDDQDLYDAACIALYGQRIMDRIKDFSLLDSTDELST